MNKMAIFVEGYTEVVFVDRLIEMIANANSVRIEWRLLSGGTTCPRTSRQLKAAQPNTGQSHFVAHLRLRRRRRGQDPHDLRISPTWPKPAIRKIICIRDVYPKFKYEDIPALRSGLAEVM